MCARPDDFHAKTRAIIRQTLASQIVRRYKSTTFQLCPDVTADYSPERGLTTVYRNNPPWREFSRARLLAGEALFRHDTATSMSNVSNSDDSGSFEPLAID